MRIWTVAAVALGLSACTSGGESSGSADTGVMTDGSTGGTGGTGATAGMGGAGGEAGMGGTGGEAGMGGAGGEAGMGGTGGEAGMGGTGGVVPCEDGAEAACEVDGCQGTQRCEGGAWGACTGPAEICNGQDDDCDGEVDEEVPAGEACETGQPGVCAAGLTACQEGAEVCVPQASPMAEQCNGLDDNCDGVVDDAPQGVGAACQTDLPGACAPGITACTAGALVCEPAAGPQAEQCNGVDDDCDGEVDEEPGDVGAECQTELPGICAAGATVCAGGALVCEALNAPAVELCDGLDNDCNGVVDDAAGIGDPCQAGVGACAVAGTLQCGLRRGPPVSDAVAGEPAAEVCNEIDDDCDGVVDNGVCQRNDALVAGIQQAVPVADALRRGWQVCHTSPYSDIVAGLGDIQQACAGDQLMLACRPVGSDEFTLAAEGARGEVLRDVGDAEDASHEHNGVAWYYSPGRSWGFFPPGQAVRRASCDVERDEGADLRMCWHTRDDSLRAGYRCGDNTLNNDAGWERVILNRRFVQVATYAIDDGPRYGEAQSMSCVEACEQLFHGSGWGCSTDAAAQNHRAHGSQWGDGSLCAEGDADEHFVAPLDRTYDCGARGCSFSAYVNDHCEANDLNRCWRAAPLSFQGVRQGLTEAELEGGGFEACWTSGMLEGGQPIADLRAACTGDVLLLGCGAADSGVLRVAAMGTRAGVLQVVADEPAASHQHNGATWYFNESRSMGFAPANAAVSRTTCDTSDDAVEQRMCWHTRDGNINAGWRCGDQLNGAGDVRVVYQRSGGL